MKLLFHVHTFISFDGYISFSDLYNECKKLGVNAVCITDHDDIKGALDFKSWLKTKKICGLEVVCGSEITCNDGTHIIGIFLSKNIKKGLTPLETVFQIKAQGGLVCFPHPARIDGVLNSNYFNSVIEYGNFVEIFNAKINNKFNLESFTKFRNTNLKFISGADAHYRIDLRKSICEFDNFEEFKSIKQYLDAYLNNKIGIKLYGYPKNSTGNNYFSAYYKIKEKIYIPYILKHLGKKIAPHYIYWKNRNKKFPLELIYSK